MNYKIEYQHCADYLKFIITGKDSLEVSLDYYKKIKEKCDETGIKKVLILENLDGTLSTGDIFKLNETLPRILLGLKIAFVDLIANHHEDNIFGENCAINRGLYLQVFENEAMAENWLLNVMAS